MRVLVANEPRVYREVLAGTLREMCLSVEVSCVEPDELDHEILRLKPHMVICSRLTSMVEAAGIGWLVLYPGGENRAVVNILGQRTTIPDMQFTQLLQLVDQTAQLAYSS